MVLLSDDTATDYDSMITIFNDINLVNIDELSVHTETLPTKLLQIKTLPTNPLEINTCPTLFKNRDKVKDVFTILKKIADKVIFWKHKLPEIMVLGVTDKNRLMPSKLQNEMLSKISLDMKFCDSNELWFYMMNPCYDFMFDAFDKRHRKKAMKDQYNRASDIIDKMQKNNQKHIITMDGHGRFILTFMRCLHEKGEKLNDWKFTVIDIDEEVNKWHNMFLPKTFTCEQHDILTYLNQHTTTEKFIYLNFCSIPSGLKEKCYETLSKLKTKKSIIVSFSIRSRCKEDYTKKNRLTGTGLMNKFVHNGAIVICKRSFFVTLYI